MLERENSGNTGIPVVAGNERAAARAASLSARLGGILTDDPPAGQAVFLELGEEGLSLRSGTLSVRGDFTAMRRRLRRDNLNGELLVRAARIRSREEGPMAVDATAGLGEDAFLLAAVGFRVLMMEHNPVIAALLEDALLRASAEPDLAPIVRRMSLKEGDSVSLLPALKERPDVVFLDPMFPSRQKSGLVNKKLQLLQRLEFPCAGEKELMDAAMSVHPRKIVVKRPSKGPWLAGIRPGYSLEGRAIRYDCIVPPVPAKDADGQKGDS